MILETCTSDSMTLTLNLSESKNEDEWLNSKQSISPKFVADLHLNLCPNQR